jgi:cell division protein FtsI (penicillin-binding protein 3)
VYLARQVTPETWERVSDLELPGIFSEPTTRRVYPASGLAASVVGFVGREGDGRGGIELAYQQELAGLDGVLTYEAGAGGRQIPTDSAAEEEPVAGSDIRLTIDRDIQWQAQHLLEAKVEEANADSGTVVVLDTRTGAIRALATAPTFDPGDLGSASAEDIGNRALSDIYEPGSTSKIMTAAAVLEEGALRAGSTVVVPASRNGTSVGLKLGEKVFHDHADHGVERLTFTGVLAKSSNIGTIIAAKKIGKDRLYGYLKKFGIGEPTGLGFPGESKGLLTAPATWSPEQFGTVAFGQGLSLNAVQAASVFATIANNGVRVQPSLVAGTVAPDGSFVASGAPSTTRVVSARTAATLRAMLESVVSDEGTAPMAKIPGYRVAGKTGTANRVDPACSCYRGYTASFIGFAPADQPRLVVAVTLQNPRNGHYGGRLAGPVFRDVMAFALQSMKVPPTGTAPPRLKLTAP